MNSERQSETCSMVLVVFGCVHACFRVPFTCPWIGRPESPVRKVSANVRGVPRLKQEAFEMRSESVPLHVRAFASDCRVMNSNPSFDRESFVGAGGPKWGADKWIRKGFADEPAPEQKRETSQCGSPRPVVSVD
ncbi:hypothetical protein CRG98_040738 [Punica granatum]|nr:hypothetical protein CRG98_040738 [Punica granatum]